LQGLILPAKGRNQRFLLFFLVEQGNPLARQAHPCDRQPSALRGQNFMEVQHIAFAADFLDFARVRRGG
jgi:hypothetical protein